MAVTRSQQKRNHNEVLMELCGTAKYITLYYQVRSGICCSHNKPNVTTTCSYQYYWYVIRKTWLEKLVKCFTFESLFIENSIVNATTHIILHVFHAICDFEKCQNFTWFYALDLCVSPFIEHMELKRLLLLPSMSIILCNSLTDIITAYNTDH